MAILIIIILIIIGVIAFKHYDRDFITCTGIDVSRNSYHLEFESGMKADCLLIVKYTIDGKNHSLFLPFDSLRTGKVPDEDIIILKEYRKYSDKTVYVFTDNESYEQVFNLAKNDIGKAEHIYQLLKNKNK